MNRRFNFWKDKSEGRQRRDDQASVNSTEDEYKLSPRATLVSRAGSNVSSGEQASRKPPTTSKHPSCDTLDSAYPTRRKSSATESDPCGLHVLYSPPQGVCDVDIVFVHGLGGTSRMTWSKNKDLDLFWPHKFLPLEPELSQARIFTFGYDTNLRLGGSKSTATILDFAKELLFELKYSGNRSGDLATDLDIGQRPIIFVVHSMGGLIVKEAYMQGLHDQQYKSIVDSIRTIVFLSTPHRGTNLAETLNRILQATLVTGAKRFIKELAQNSYTLQRLNEQFRHISTKLEIVSFYETRPTSGIMVLEKDSAVLGYPGEISKPLDADHHGVCKYEHRQDPLYLSVRNVLTRIVGHLGSPLASGNSRTPPDPSVPESKLEEFFSIHAPPDNDFTFFRDRWTPGTCTWILQHTAFISWIEDNESKPRLLWIHGSAASGKSVLSSFVIDYLIRNGKPCQYFFVRFGDQDKRSVSVVLRSLAYQVAQAVPAYRARLMQLVSNSADLKTLDVRNTWDLLFRSGLRGINLEKPIYFVLDGVDESDKPQTVVKLWADLSTHQIPIRLLIVSRKTQDLANTFQRLGKNLQMDAIQTEGNLHDFRKFIEEELDDMAGDEFHNSRITSLILERARGNFLWVHLAVKRINECISQKDVEDALEMLPPGMEGLYDRMASTIANSNASIRKLVYDIVEWTTCARRLMTIDELSAALDQKAPLNLQRSIGVLCGGFVVVDMEGKIALVHQTAREYLFSDFGRPFSIQKHEGHKALFQKCMDCLVEPSLRLKINRNQEPGLLDYAMSSWFVHLSLADASSSSVLPRVSWFLQQPHVLTWIHAVIKSGNLDLLVLASQYLTKFLAAENKRVEHDAIAGIHMGDYDVIERWATDLVKIVCKFGRSLIMHPQAIYKLIAPFCPHESIMYQQFGREGKGDLSVSGFANIKWDDCLGRITMEHGAFTAAIMTAGNRIAILSRAGPSSRISIYHASTFAELQRITHPERVLRMQVNNSGNILATYGFLTTRIWDLLTGECMKCVDNPKSRPWPQTMLFTEGDNTLVIGFDDRRLRALTLIAGSNYWEPVADFDEQQHEKTVVNSATCSALNPEGDHIVFGYRGHPLTLWEVNGSAPIAQCTRTLDISFKTTAAQAWGEVIRLAWHPFSGEVIGLYLEGTLFKWQPFADEVKEITTGANELAISRDGSLCATGDANGTIQVYNTADFSLFYKLSTEDPILGISFSTDSSRLYDIRGSYANIWEPEAMIHLANSIELLERSSDTASTYETLIKTPFIKDEYMSKIDGVTAISAPISGTLYCYGTEDGLVYLCEAGEGRIAILGESRSQMPIEHIVWSPDSTRVAFVDTSGRLVIKGIRANPLDGERWVLSPILDAHVAIQKGGIKQLLFHAQGHKILAFSETSFYVLGIHGSKIKEVPIGTSPVPLTWICHPSEDQYIIGFGTESLHIYSWEHFEQVNVMPFHLSQPRKMKSTKVTDQWRKSEASVTSILAADSAQILLQISRPSSAAWSELYHVMIPVDAIKTRHAMTSTPSGATEIDHLTPPFMAVDLADVDAELGQPLSFLPGGKLIFLTEDHWVCTSRLPTTSNVGRKRSGASLMAGRLGLVDFKRHYLLPGDWVSVENAELCCILSDGSLLYPRAGEVAVVRSESLRPGII